MLINNIDISNFNAELKNRIIYTTNVRSSTDWMEEGVTGTLLNQRYDWRTIRLTFIVTGANEDESYQKTSLLIGALKKCVIKFDDINVEFPCVINGSVAPERLQNGTHKLTIDLKNDWGFGDMQVASFDIQGEDTDTKHLVITYRRDWSDTMGFTKQAFADDEVKELVGQGEYYVDLAKIASSTAQSWEELFLELGVELNTYRQVNEQYGKLDIEDEFDLTNAYNIISQTSGFTVLYKRMQVDGYNDLPTGKTYPSEIWTLGTTSSSAVQSYYFITDIGEGWDIQDLSVEVIGRQTSGGNKYSSFFGYGPTGDITTDEGYDGKHKRNAYFYRYFNDSYYDYKNSIEFGDGTTPNNAIYKIIRREEEISYASSPLSTYGLRTSNRGESPIEGYEDVIFAGATLSRVPTTSFELPTNLYIAYGGESQYQYTDYNQEQGVHTVYIETALFGAEIARVRIWHNDTLVRDYVPISGSVKNGFVNNYDTGLYDTITMKYLPWSKLDGTTGPAPASDIIPFPS